LKVRIGKWAEAKLVFKDTSTGQRGIIRSPTTLPNYLRMYIGSIPVPASSTLGTGGTVRVTKSTHGLDTIVGGLATLRNKSNTSSIYATLINASTIEFVLPGYTAATTTFDVLIWGTSSL
jgi:hypothetical protein